MARLRLRLSNVFLRAFRIRRRRRRQKQSESMVFLKNSSSASTLLEQAVCRAAPMPTDAKQQQKKTTSKSKKQSKSSSSSSSHRSLQKDKGLLLGCNPCAGRSSGMVVEDYKFKLGVQRRGYYNKHEKVPSSGIWEREKSWNIVAKMGDKIVAKKIVLKKKKRHPVPCSVSHSSDNLLGQTTMFYDEASCLSSKYRLSTSSGDACHWESGRLVWDKELSFVSGDDFGLEDDLDPFERLESSTKDGFSSFRKSPRHRGRFEFSKQFPSPYRSEDEADDEWDDEENKEEVGQGGSVGFSGSVSDVSGWSSSEDKPKLGQCRGQAVFKKSVDPYRDYMESVLAMMAANHLSKVSELEELKRCYLLLNPPELHETIATVFNQVLLTTKD